ncbi:3D domain-containing protein [Neobacillus sp. PS3-12]|uniref:LysM peptidoglycan-binding and 3D domain-containing protein n=1 Tax=Neobacillus sp. PS3-12 TaxID=3070677 RepID=UPI0027E0D550|nr:LysM peptidoglycan-binding domain-containing protein [Neobacillus sp. PS3-12]WML53705.1 3D domain-containing protein [Neobacillus sp. PS3-12]
MFKTIKTLIAVAALSGTVGANVQAKEVTVQKGDTLWKLSQVHNASIENIKSWNQLASELIQQGDILKIAKKKHYTVKQGDTLISIANENNVTAQNLIEWNDLYTNLVHPGLNLVIFDNSATLGQMEPVKQGAASTTETPLEGSTTATSPTQTGSQVPESASSSSLVDTITHQENATVPVNNSSETAVQAAAPTPAAPASESTPTAVQVPTPTPAAPALAPTPAPAPAQTSAPAAPAQADTQSAAPKEITVKATAYTADCEGCSGITKTGVNLKANPDEKVIAVDPSVIPLGSKVYIEGYGEATAADTGGAIKGNRIDVYMQNESDALQFGAKELTVKILN